MVGTYLFVMGFVVGVIISITICRFSNDDC